MRLGSLQVLQILVWKPVQKQEIDAIMFSDARWEGLESICPPDIHLCYLLILLRMYYTYNEGQDVGQSACTSFSQS